MRTKTGTVRKRRHNKVLAKTKGYRMTKSKLYKVAHESAMHAGQYSYNDRRKRAGQFRQVWISRLNAACKNNGIQYNTLISGLKKKNIELNRKVLSDIAVNEPEVFSFIIKSI